MSDSVHWWNSVVNYEDDSDEPPEMVSPSEMAVIWQDISPIFHTHVIEMGTEEEYWEAVRDCLVKLTEDLTIPKPTEDFPKFVESLYKYIDLIKISNIESAINYAKHFCPEDSNTFFVSEFLFSVSDPFLTVQAIHEMNKKHEEPWSSYIQRYGAIERFFDLFITFLQPANKNIENEYETFRLVLAEVMTSLVCDVSIDNMESKKKVASSLYLRLLNLIIYSGAEASISFARFAIMINKVIINDLSTENAIMRLVALINATPATKQSHNMVVEYVISQAGKHIPHSLLAIEISKHIATPKDMIAMYKLGMMQADAGFTAVRALSRIMVQYKVMAKLAAELVSQLLNQYKDSENIVSWYQKYLRMVFILIDNCAKREKYTLRIRSICILLSSDILRSVPFVKDTMLQTANACYILGNAKFLVDYFPCGKQFPYSASFIKEAQKPIYSKFKLKNFPFKGSTQLIANSKSKKGVNTEIRQFQNDSAIDLDLPPEIIKYIYKNSEASTIDQQNCIFTLEDFIDQLKEKIDKVRQKQRRHNHLSKSNMHAFNPKSRMLIIGIRMCAHDLDNQITNYQINTLSKYIDIAREIISVLRTQNGLMADTKYLNRELNKGSFDAQYKDIKAKKHDFRKFAQRISKRHVAPRYTEELTAELTTRNLKFDMTLQYAPPGDLDLVLNEYLKRSVFSNMIDATATVLEDGTLDGAVSTIWELNSAIIDTLSIKLNQNMMVLYNTLIRIIFDYAYRLNPNPMLNRYRNASTEFRKLAEEYAKKPISVLNISTNAINLKRQKMPISTLIRARSLSFEPLEFMVCPLEMLYFINQIIHGLPSQSLTGNLTDKETKAMLFGLLVSTPPSNIMAIAVFLKKWGNLISSTVIQTSKDMFLDSVRALYDLDNVKDD